MKADKNVFYKNLIALVFPIAVQNLIAATLKQQRNMADYFVKYRW